MRTLVHLMIETMTSLFAMSRRSAFRSDTHPLKEKITSDPDKFFQVLQSIKLRHGQFVGWAPVTYYKCSEWHSGRTTTDTRVNILVDLHALTMQQVREVAGLFWRDSNARSFILMVHC